MIYSTKAIQLATYKHFSDFYKVDKEVDFHNQEWFIQNMSMMFDKGENDTVGRPI